MTQLSVFQKIGQIVLSSKARQDQEYEEFFKFYRALVETTDGEVATAIGTTNVDVVCTGWTAHQTWGIKLTPADYLFWKEKYAIGVRFKYSLEAVKAAILAKMVNAAQDTKLTAEERKQLLALLDEPTT